MPFQICKKFCTILNNLIFNQEKLKMCKFPLTGCLKKICIFFAKLVKSVSLCHRLSKKLNFIQIWQVKVGQNKDLVCYRKKAVIQAVCLRTQAVSIEARFYAYREGFGYVEKVRKFQQPQTKAELKFNFLEIIFWLIFSLKTFV